MKPSKEIVAHLERCFEQQITEEQVKRLRQRATFPDGKRPNLMDEMNRRYKNQRKNRNLPT